MTLTDNSSLLLRAVLRTADAFFFLGVHPIYKGTAGHRVDPTSAFDRALLAGARLTAAMRLAVEQELGFTVSAGIASNKVLAKLASSINKPNKQVRTRW